MKLNLQIAFDPSILDVDLSSRNAQINEVHHTHVNDWDGAEISSLEMNVSVDPARSGRHKSLITMHTDRYGFTFCPLDLLSTGNLYLQAYGVTIHLDDTTARRPMRAGLSKLQAVELQNEESFETAAHHTQDIPCPTLLGLGLDQRQFLIETDLQRIRVVNSVRHRLASVHIPIGRGKGVRSDVHRHLDHNTLPILHGEVVDEDIRYDTLMFTTLVGDATAGPALTEEMVTGTPYLVAEEGLGMPHTPKQVEQRERSRQAMLAHLRLPLVLCYRLRATNTSAHAAYAFFYQPHLALKTDQEQPLACHDGVLTLFDNVYGAAWLGEQPWQEAQVVILLAPGETVQTEYRLVHEPLRLADTASLTSLSFDELLANTRKYWQVKLNRSTRIELPEPRIQHMFQAGLTHLSLVIYGERGGTLAPCVGVYSPIGSESSPIIQYLDSVGWHDIAAACLQYFLDKQHDDGRFQNFGDYMLETGAALYTMGEHYRYTRDDEWVRRIKDQVALACKWIIRHHHEDAPNAQPGAGLITGKVADPADNYRQFMLNAYQYIGLARAAEMLHGVDPTQADAFAREAADLRTDIRAALAESIVRSPVVPLGDGRWVPTCAPWVEASGPDAFALEGQNSYTHEAVYARDSLLGPLYTVFCEVLDPHEPLADFLVESHYEHMCFEGVAFSQPYYSRHPFVHLRRGEVKAFLRSFYRAMAALADRETYTFWEHLFGVSPHKTHEEAWFLMEARTMLYAESGFNLLDGGTLNILSGVPRAFLRQGQYIHLENAWSYYGKLNLDVRSQLDQGWITIEVTCPQGIERRLKSLQVRLPHPDGCAVQRIESEVEGQYNPGSESVSFNWPATNHLKFVAYFPTIGTL